MSTVPTPARFAKALWARAMGGQKRLVMVKPRRADLDQLADWLGQGQLRAVIDRKVAVNEVFDGFRRLESKRARGKIVVAVSDGQV